MIRPNFLTAADRLELLSCVKGQREDHGVARRANALLLLDDGMSCAQIAKVLFLDDDTVRSWHKQYLAEDWEAVRLRWVERRAVTDDDCSRGGIYANGLRNGSAVQRRRSEPIWAQNLTSTILILAASSFWPAWGSSIASQRRCPVWLNVEKQAAFIAFYENLLNNLPADEAVYFSDAVHPEYQSKPSYGWARKGSNPAIQTTSGRGRVNIHGALNLETFDAPFVEPTTVDGVSAPFSFSLRSRRGTLTNVSFTSFGTMPHTTKAPMSERSCRAKTVAFI